MATTILDPAPVERFKRDFERLSGSEPACERIGLAVSGGPDSMALLLLGHAAYGDRILAATVDHGLRPEASEEAAFVSGVCGDLGVEHQTITLRDEAVPSGGNIQAKARRSRYAVIGERLAGHDCHLVATAHHVEDQAETVLMRLARGSGVQGLGGVRPKTSFPLRPPLGDLRIVRPLLEWHRADLHAIVTAAGITPVLDPSNHDHAFDRVRFRALLAREKLLDPERLARVAANSLDAEDAIRWAADHIQDERLVWRDDTLAELDLSGLPRAIRRVLVGYAMIGMLVRMWAMRRSLERIDAFIANIERKGIATLAGVKCVARGDIWTFTPAAPRRSG